MGDLSKGPNGAPDCAQDDVIEFAIDFDEFTSLNAAFSKERRCVDVGI
jgi:hypothetical protein